MSFRKLISNLLELYFYSTLPILIILFLLPEFLLSFFGAEFTIAKNTLLILLVGQVGNAMSGSVGYILQMTGNEKLFQNILTLALLLNIVLNFLLIPKYGIIGVAIASSMYVFGILTSVYIYIYKKYNVLTLYNFK